jgi:enoyl-CoA hydratase/carnithine racemase
MPETGIGYFPDVGATHFLGRLPGRLGEYLAVTGSQLDADDALYAGLADLYVPEEYFANLDITLDGADPRTLDSLKAGLSGAVAERRESRLEALQPVIDEHFAKATLAEVRESLRGETRPDYEDWASLNLAGMEGRSPLGMAVALELVRRGRNLSLAEAFALELKLDYQWFDHGDIVEGIRALIVDKDKSPKWRVATIDDLTPEHLSVFFDDVR